MAENALKLNVKSDAEAQQDPVFNQPTNPNLRESKELAKLVAYGDERRHFNRASVGEKKLEIHFADGAQFARQYIENISVGGLFVRSDRKAKTGDLLPIEFSIPRQDRPDENLSFVLMSRVCRVTQDGLGLEFLNLSHENRRSLEEYVRAVLPTGVPIAAKPKAATVAHLQEQRQKRQTDQESKRSFAIRFVILAVMCCLNGYMLSKKAEQDTSTSLKTTDIRHSLHVGEKQIEDRSIQSIRLVGQKNIIMTLQDGSTVTTDVSDFDRKAPHHILQSVAALQSIEIPKTIRKNKNSGRLTRMR